jgi:hypothetical protein
MAVKMKGRGTGDTEEKVKNELKRILSHHKRYGRWEHLASSASPGVRMEATCPMS